MADRYSRLIEAETAAAMLLVEAELAFLAEAKLDDLAMVADIMERAVDAHADPRLVAGVAALALMANPSLAAMPKLDRQTDQQASAVKRRATSLEPTN